MKFALWDQYDAQRKHDYTMRQEGKGETQFEYVCKMYSHGMTPEQVHEILEIPMDRLLEIQASWKENSRELPANS